MIRRTSTARVAASLAVLAAVAGACRDPACPRAQVACGEGCFDLMSAPQHCGECDIACKLGESCSEGVCTPPGCSGALPDACPDACTNLERDAANCGECGNACQARESCVDRVCVVAGCASGQIQCGGACVDPATSRAYCGAKNDCAGASGGVACAADQVCVKGACAASCPADRVFCDSTCVDPRVDRVHCGGSGDCRDARAGAQCGPGAICEAGACAPCAPGRLQCSTRCVNPETDRQSCGATGDCLGARAGIACGPLQVCAAGACALSCPTGQVNCAGTCVRPSSDRDYCGASGTCAGVNAGTVCGSGEVCVGGACALSCPPGQIVCQARCVFPATDRDYCGATGNCAGPNAGVGCATGEVCGAGTCGATCAAPLTRCSNACVDTRFDPTHCGACGAACPEPPSHATALCAAPTCSVACAAGYGDCNADLAAQGGDGCETAVTTDVRHCGRCGDPCPTAARCTASACQPALTVSATVLAVNESGTTATFDVVLLAPPASAVVIGVTSMNTGEVTVTPAALTFGPTTWNIVQTVTVRGEDDGVADGDKVVTVITGSTASADPSFDQLAVPDVSVTNREP